LPKGTRVEMEYTYDNSQSNPRNPANPPVRVRWGEQTTDEMALAFLTVVVSSRFEAQVLQQEIQAQYVESIFVPGITLDDFPPELSAQQRNGLVLVFNLFDRNKDGKLDESECNALIQFLRSRRQ